MNKRNEWVTYAHLFLFLLLCCSAAVSPGFQKPPGYDEGRGNPPTEQKGQKEGATDEPNLNPAPGQGGDRGNPPPHGDGQKGGMTDEPNPNPPAHRNGDRGNPPPAQEGQKEGTTDEPNPQPPPSVVRLQAELMALRRKLQEKNLEYSNLEDEIKVLQERMKEQRIHPRLLDLHGPFGKTVILIDMSGSMTDRRKGDGVIPWLFTKNQMTTWLKHLDLKECAIIFFSEDVTTMPARVGTYCNVSDNDAKRVEMTEYLESKAKHGVETDMLKALSTAYTNYRGLDTIVMFTDFKPETESLTPDQLKSKILALCRQHPNIPINCIGLGGYDSNSDFLRNLVSVTNGTFLGR